MHLHFERNINAKCDCTILSLSWMGKVPDELPEDVLEMFGRQEEGWKLNRTNYYQEGWLATGNVRGIVGVTFTTSHCRRGVDLPLRTNYNLRGHRSDVILVKWNEPYQKLASCDSSGVIFVWIKYEGRWSIELINDRSTPVTHFSWSHDGRMALICYQDGFVLVGSVAGQRYWSSMLTLEARITCGCWTPDDAHVYLGTAAGQLVVMDVHGAMVSQVQLSLEGGITAMAWSCEKFKMEENEDEREKSGVHILAIAFSSGGILLLRGYDDVTPIRINTAFDGSTLAMEWANSRELLAVAGALLPTADLTEITEAVSYKNFVKFYSDVGILLYSVEVPYTQAAVSALTWGHAGRRLFVATGAAVHVARVWRRVAPLQLLARVRAAAALPAAAAAAHLPLPPPLLPLIAGLFANTIRCCVPEAKTLREFVSRPPHPPARLHCTMLRHEDDESSGYTLYLEHLGGLVPLLKGRRTSKIRPEFVIFDPQGEDVGVLPVISSESSSSGSSGSGSSSANSAGSTRSTATRAFPTPSDSSDTDREEGCSGSPRLQRKRKARRRMRNSCEKEINDPCEELAYVDSLPEDIRLVEVTSNIWGTKFKMHGLAKNVPANLGQVTYKTSLLHLQPRQMTLVITELRDDYPVGPDPNFNPNIFSEDEEEVFQPFEKKSSSSSSHQTSPYKRNTLMLTERKKLTNASNCHTDSDNSTNPSTTNNNTVPALARAESYEEELPYIDINEVVSYCENVHLTGCNKHAITSSTERRITASTSVSNRNAISPLRCDGSVPTLQSPKNAVAPTDIIFERPSPQTVPCGIRGDFVTSRAEFSSIRTDNLQQIKNNLSSIDQPMFNLNISVEPARQVTIKKIETHCSESKHRKNSLKGEPCQETCGKIQKCSAIAFRSQENESHTDHMADSKRKNDDLKFIDEENSVDNVPLNPVDETKVHRTTTVMPISPVCSSLPVYDNMTRSCSVGYLDFVDPQLMHSGLTLTTLRREEPKRLILVNRKSKNNVNKRNMRKQMIKNNGNVLGTEDGLDKSKAPNLKMCGKSKSLDSNELRVVSESKLPNKLNLESSIEDAKPLAISNDEPKVGADVPSVQFATLNHVDRVNEICVTERVSKLSFFTRSKTPQPRRKSRKDIAKCTLCACADNSSGNNSRQDAPGNSVFLCNSCKINTDNNTRNETSKSGRKESESSHCAERAIVIPDNVGAGLEDLIHRLQLDRPVCLSSASAPATPRLPRSTPSSPAPSAGRAKRNSSASPIRQLLNSPLLNRRRNKKQSESSDEEWINQPLEYCCGRNFKDLESFQKAQLRQKLKRCKNEQLPNNVSNALPRRQLIMHNKAPMWNENSQVYQLDFGGRVTQESAKNFQIEYHGKQVMQFGRIDGSAYTLDFQYPFSALQAFSVALANVTQRLK